MQSSHLRGLPALAAAVLAMFATVSPAAAIEQVLELDREATSVTFELDTTLHLVHGTMVVDTGAIRFDLETGDASGEIVLDARATETGNDGRDKKMHKTVLESETYPTIVFRPRHVESDSADGGSGVLRIEGEIEIHGDRHPLAVEAEVAFDGDRATGTTTFVVPYVEWGMHNPSVFILRVAKEIEVTVQAAGRARTAGPSATTAHRP